MAADPRSTRQLICLAATVLLTPSCQVAFAKQSVTNLTRLQELVGPAIVRVVAGYEGKWTWKGKPYFGYAVSTGTGFVVDSRGYLVTNAHVVEQARVEDEVAQRSLLMDLAEELLSEDGKTHEPPQITALAKRLEKEATLQDFRRYNVVVLQSGTQLRYEIKAYGSPALVSQELVIGKDVAVLKVELRNAPTLRLGDSDLAQAGSTILAIGYPGAAELPAPEQSQADWGTLEPTANAGSVAARKRTQDGALLLQTNAAIAPGSSGGPAVDDEGQVVGLATFGDTKWQGFGFLIPSNTAMEFVRQAGAANEPGPVDMLWREGLEHYWKEEYSLAKGKFSDALALFPDHARAKRLLADSQERILKGQDHSRSMGVRPWVLVVAVAIAVGGILLLRRKVKPSVARTTGAGPSGAAPPARKQTEVFLGAGDARLECMAGSMSGRQFPIGAGVYLGRESDQADVLLDDPQVSGRHAWIGPVGSAMTLRDCGSTNGTFLNDDLSRRVKEVELKEGDSVVLGQAGRVRLRYLKSGS